MLDSLEKDAKTLLFAANSVLRANTGYDDLKQKAGKLLASVQDNINEFSYYLKTFGDTRSGHGLENLAADMDDAHTRASNAYVSLNTGLTTNPVRGFKDMAVAARGLKQAIQQTRSKIETEYDLMD